MSWIGLAAIALGTGGIKPCVAAFGGDQFGPGQEKQLQKFFSFFYISINAGSLLSTFITPILGEGVYCFGRTDCFPLAFGVSSVLIIVALALFLLGRKWFKRTAKRDNLLDYVDNKYDVKQISILSKLT
jgi:solute carrier family 15 oligopeptide transporter 1